MSNFPFYDDSFSPSFETVNSPTSLLSTAKQATPFHLFD